MAEPIGSLNVKLGLDSAQFTTGLKKSQSELGGFAKAAGNIGAAVGAALAATAVAVGAAVKQAIDNADQLDELAQKIGVGVEELSRLKYAAEISGVSLDTLSTGIRRLSAGLAEAAGKGTGKAAEALSALGISAVDTSGKLRASEDVLKDVAGKFSGIEDGAGKTALAMSLFGKSGADLIPLLNEGADGIARLEAEADALGVTLSSEAAEAAGKFNENLDRLKAVGQGLANQLMTAVAPALLSISNSLLAASQNTELMDGLGKALSITLRTLASAGVIVAAAFSATGKTIGAVSRAIGLAVKGDFAAAGAAMNEQALDISAVVKSVKMIWTDVPSSGRAQASRVSDGLAAPLVEGSKKIKAAGDRAAKDAKDANDKIREAAEGVYDGLLTADERYEKDYRANRAKLDEARNADLISLERYLDAVGRLEREREGRDIGAAIKAPSRVDFGPSLPEVEELDTELGDLIERLDEARRAADDVAYSIEDIYYGFKNNNWGMAVSGLLRAVQSVQKAFAAGGTPADKFSALAGVAQGVGSAIGGTAGAGISGAASGALAGFTVGGPVGAVIGGLIGGLGGLLGGSSAKKKAKREAEERARQAEAERLARVEAARKEIEIRLMELSGDAAGALAKRREYELAAMDASLHEQQKAVWAAEDLAEAQAKLAAISATRRDLEIELMQAMGNSAGAIAAQREEYLKGVDAGLQPLQKAVWSMLDANAAVSAAQDVARDAYERDAEMFRENIDRFRGIAASLRGYSESIGLAEERTDSLAAAARNFAKVSAAARLGDEGAMGQLEGAGEALRSVARSQAKNLLEQVRIDAQVKAAAAAAADTAERHATIAEQQLDALTKTLPQGLVQIDKTVITVREAIVALNETMAAQAALQSAVSAQFLDLAQGTQAAAQAAAITALAGELAKVAKSSETTADVLQRVTRDGESMVIAA